MSELIQFVRSFSDNDRLIRAAEPICGKVDKVFLDSDACGLELVLNIEKVVPEGRVLIDFEREIRKELNVSHVRIHLEGEAVKKVSECVAGPLRSWIIDSVSRKNPLFRLLTDELELYAEGSGVVGSVTGSVDSSLLSEFSKEAEIFTDRYLPSRCLFELRVNTGSKDDTNRKRIERYEVKLMRDALEVLSRQSTMTGNGNDQARTDSAGNQSITDKKTDPSESGSNTWETLAGQAVSERNGTREKRPRNRDNGGIFWGRMNPALPLLPIGEMNESTGTVLFEGEIEIEEMKLTKSGNKVCSQFFVTDRTGSIPCVCFFTPKDADRFSDAFLSGGYARLQADVCFDARYTKDLSASVVGIRLADAPEQRRDDAEIKRVELHCHSKMSEKDAVINVSDLISEAARMGHRACALTDHGVVQGFPEAAEAAAKIRKADPDSEFKVIYGMEGYLVDDGPCPVYLPVAGKTPSEVFVALRVETSGSDPELNRITRVRAARFERDSDDVFRCTATLDEHFTVPEKDPVITEPGEESGERKTGNEVLSALTRVSDFIGSLPVCGVDILTALSFLRYAGFAVDIEKHENNRVKFNPVAVEILELEKLPESYGIYASTNESGDKVEERADISGKGTNSGVRTAVVLNTVPCDPDLSNDASVLAGAILRLSVTDLAELNEKAGRTSDRQLLSRKETVSHVVFLARNILGLYHLYRLVSESHIRYYSHRPRIPKSLLKYYRDGLIIGSACERGEVFSRIRMHYTMNNRDFDKACHSLKEDEAFLGICRVYDYLEVQPLTNNSFYLRSSDSGIANEQDLINLNRLVLFAADTVGIPACATTDAHFLEKRDGEFRKYLLMDMEYKDAEFQGDLFFRTTHEMLDEFSYLGTERAFEVVVANPNAIADKVAPDIKPFPHGTFPPIIDTAADEIREVTRRAVEELYTFRGQVSQVVEERLNKELNSIIGNGFAIMYYIAYMLVKKSNEDGYIVGSRGSVGSSLVATLCGISEVNPLPPHYRCPGCSYSEFDTSGRFGSGYDLPDKNCPHCGTDMHRDGQEIPFETFLGFYGDKQPDIDLNFSSEYQSRAHRYVEELFGTSHTFRAGTIGCFAEKNAIAVINKVCEKKQEAINRAETRRRARGLFGVKRTTGQHPGGIVVVPKEMDIFEFTPIQFPANKSDAGVITTHFDFNAMHDTILKLDILGHYDPTVLRMLSDLTGVDVRTIPIPEPKVMSLFISNEALGIKDKSYKTEAATLGLSEMGTFMARDMIAETKPSKFFDLVQLMGLSHGTDVWKGNAQELIRKNICTLENVIGCRDSIMTELIQKGIRNKDAFGIMERVRKGKGLLPDQEKTMQEYGVPKWYIESCKIIKYMFPKAHAAAYAISSLRIAWFKVYYPEEYYCAFFSIRADEFDGDTMCRGIELVKAKKAELHEGFSARKPTEKAQYYIYELIEEMYARGIEFLPFDLDLSQADRFVKAGPGKILPPINAITSVSSAMARAICAARNEKSFSTREDVLIRSGIGPSALEKLAASGILDHLPETVQIDLFSLL